MYTTRSQQLATNTGSGPILESMNLLVRSNSITIRLLSIQHWRSTEPCLTVESEKYFPFPGLPTIRK